MSKSQNGAQLRHKVTSEDYPAEWARRLELFLDEGHRRIFLYAGIFGTFVLVILAVALVSIVANAPPL